MSLTLTTGPGLGEAHKIPDKCMNGAEAGGGGSASVWGRRSKEEGTDGLWTSQMNTGQIAFHVTGSKTVFQKQSTRMLLWKKKYKFSFLL